jgi:hypothetical protein
MRWDASVGQQIGQPSIAEGGFEHRLDRLVFGQLAEDPPYLVRLAPHPTTAHQLTLVVHYGKL